MLSKRMRIVAVVMASALLVGLTGCDWLISSNLASFGAGFLAGRATVPTQTTCYENGEVIDCANLPAELQP